MCFAESLLMALSEAEPLQELCWGKTKYCCCVFNCVPTSAVRAELWRFVGALGCSRRTYLVQGALAGAVVQEKLGQASAVHLHRQSVAERRAAVMIAHIVNGQSQQLTNNVAQMVTDGHVCPQYGFVQRWLTVALSQTHGKIQYSAKSGTTFVFVNCSANPKIESITS